MTAYYNEHDRFAAAWLRELIARNLIAPGDVDERSIVDVEAADLAEYDQCHFFAGDRRMVVRSSMRRMARRAPRVDGLMSLPAFLERG